MMRGTVLVPLRGVLEKLDATVSYDHQDARIDIVRGSQRIMLRPGSREAVVDVELHQLKSAPRLMQGHVYLPLRDIAELFGYEVNWAPATRTVSIGSPGPHFFDTHGAALKKGGAFGIGVDASGASTEEIERLVQEVRQSGAGMLKVRFDWATLEPERGSAFNWAPFDLLVRRAREAQLVVVGVLGNCTRWASRIASADETDWLNAPPSEENMPAFLNYVRRTVGRYKNDVHAWQIWEHPSSVNFHSTPQAYEAVVRQAVPVALEADPHAVLHAADPGGVKLGDLQQLWSSPAAHRLSGLELYPVSQWQPGVLGQADDFLLPFATLRERLLNATRADLWVGGLTCPVFEGAPASAFQCQDKAVCRDLQTAFSEHTQADYLMQSAAMALATGSSKVFWSTLRDAGQYRQVDPINPEYGSGLLRRDWTPRDSMNAFTTLCRMLADKPYTGNLKLGPDAMALLFSNRNDADLAVWSLGAPIKLSLNSQGVDPQIPGAVFVSTLPGSKVLDSAGRVLAGADGLYEVGTQPVWITEIASATTRLAQTRHQPGPLRVVRNAIPQRTEVKALFQNPDGEQGIWWRKLSRFRAAAALVTNADGSGGLLTSYSRDTFNPAAGRFFIYLDVDNSFMYFEPQVPVTVTVEVHRLPRRADQPFKPEGGFEVNYEGPHGYQRTHWQKVEEGDGWVNYTFKLPDAVFADRDGYDLFISTFGSRCDLLFRSVTIQRAPVLATTTTSS